MAFQNGEMKKQGQNKGIWLANDFLQTNLLIGRLQNLLLLATYYILLTYLKINITTLWDRIAGI